jgi:hypothetical protein
MLPSRGRFVNQLSIGAGDWRPGVFFTNCRIQCPSMGRPTLWPSVIVRLVRVVCCGGKSQTARPAFMFDRRACFPAPTWRRLAAVRNVGDGRSGATRSHAQTPWRRAWRGWRAPDLVWGFRCQAVFWATGTMVDRRLTRHGACINHGHSHAAARSRRVPRGQDR